MKIFKKIAVYTTALLLSLGLGITAAACGENKDSSSESNISQSDSLVSSSESAQGSDATSSSSASENVSSSTSSSSSEESSSSEDSTSSNENSSSSEDSSSSTESANFVYRVEVKTIGGFGLSGVTVKLMNGDEIVSSKRTLSSGYATFRASDILELGEYTIQLENLPAGYAMVDADATYQTLPVKGFEASILFEPTGVIMDVNPIGVTYPIGSVMYDFSVTASDGTVYTLSELLQEKEMVMLNFWATWCSPCKQEFPAMNNAYIAYKDKIEILAVSTTDNRNAVAGYKSSSGITFPMASLSDCSIDLTQAFGVSSIPHTVMIDRYGVVTFAHVGSMTEMQDFTKRFDLFVGDDYVPTVIVGDGEDVVRPGGDEEDNRVKPNVEAPAFSDVANVLNNSDNFNYRWQPEDPAQHDEYSWPWVLSADKQALETPIKNIHGAYVQLYVDFHANAGDTLSFDYYVSSESTDILYILVDGVIVQKLSGAEITPTWKTCNAYVFLPHETGDHELVFLYLKDGDTSAGEDIAKIRNLTVEHKDDVDALVFHYAASVLNTDENAKTQFKYYITPVYNEEDGYYHVNSADGPLLFANIMNVSPWSDTSVWLLAYYDYVISDGYNFHTDIEAYAWEANNNMVNFGYTPVTQELRTLLEYVAASESVKASGYKNWQGEYHENEWLEMCVYYQHYGNAEPFADPMETITFHAAKQVYEGENEATVLFAMTPRGFKHKFIPETSGVYHIYSVGDTDTFAFFATDNQQVIGSYDDLVWATKETADGKIEADKNFSFYAYMEAGKTYYILLTTFLDQPATYTYCIDYIDETYTFLDNCAVGPYSYNEITGELFIPGAIDYVYADPTQEYVYNSPDGDLDGDGTDDVPVSGTALGDGYYHYRNADGTLGSVLYLDTNRPTAYFTSISLFDICRDAQNYDPVKRALYINGHDYTNEVQLLCAKSIRDNKNDKKGMIAVDKEIFALLQTITRSEKYDGVEETEGNVKSWLLFCYYSKLLNATTIL